MRKKNKFSNSPLLFPPLSLTIKLVNTSIYLFSNIHFAIMCLCKQRRTAAKSLSLSAVPICVFCNSLPFCCVYEELFFYVVRCTVGEDSCRPLEPAHTSCLSICRLITEFTPPPPFFEDCVHLFSATANWSIIFALIPLKMFILAPEMVSIAHVSRFARWHYPMLRYLAIKRALFLQQLVPLCKNKRRK